MTNAATESAPPPTKAPDSAPGPRLVIESLAVKLGQDALRLQAPLTMRAGKLYVLWGPSGSGKSSFARALLGLGELSQPRAEVSGEATLFDALTMEHPLWRGNAYSPQAREQIAFLPQAEKLGFIDGLSTAENLRLFSRLPAKDAQVQADLLAARFHLMGLPKKLARASGGERMRLSAVRALMPRVAGEAPAMLIADEPTAGLDTVAAHTLARELVSLARRKDCIVVIITHDPAIFTGQEPPEVDRAANAKTVRVLECGLGEGDVCPIEREAGQLRIEPGRPENEYVAAAKQGVMEFLALLGGLVLAPLAFLLGLARIKRPLFVARQTLGDALGPGTQLFSWLGSLLIAGTVAYFIFMQLPRPELVEPLLISDILEATGHTLARVVLPLGAAAFITGKLGAAQAARLSSSVRSGLLETLALARWPAESFGLVSAVLAQTIAMALATGLALSFGMILASLIYVAGHEGASLGLALDLMKQGLAKTPTWSNFLIAKVLLSGFVGGSIAALFGLAPATSENDVAKAVHRTLLWSILGVIATQCIFIIWEFAK
ncbi:MAG: ATP-binding cassette domain-containing protein [Planctomycetes bacterium]|nr:ATP-binding cassette domain-containing protein [Planctomycetota bacterium]